MGAATTTYRAAQRGAGPADLVASLRGAGFEVAGTERVSVAVLDTFDGRLAAAGLRLELTEPATRARRTAAKQLVLRGGGGAPAGVTVPGQPRVAADVPAGPLRFRLAKLIDVRVLLRLLTVTTDRTVAVKRNGAGKVTASVIIHEWPVAADAHLDERAVVEVIELEGYPKAAEEVRALIEQLGLGELPGDVIDLAARAAGVDLAGTSIAPGVPLHAGTPAADGFRDVLANLRDAILANWEGTIADIDPEFLHDLRVAVRRTRSVLANAKRVLSDDVRQDARNDFGWLGQITGPARDLDVYQIEWPSYVATLGIETTTALEPVRAHLEGERDAAHETLAKDLAGEQARHVIDRWSDWLDKPSEPADPPRHADRPIGDLIEKRVRRAHRTMIDRGRTVESDTPAEVLHELRKDAKKLRYLLECFGGLYEPPARKAFVQRLKSLQDNLGEHQDAEVHVDHLRKLSSTLAPTSTTDTMLATGQLIERLEQRRIACRNEFAERFEAFDSPKTRDALDALLASARP